MEKKTLVYVAVCVGSVLWVAGLCWAMNKWPVKKQEVAAMPKITEIEVTKERNYINDPKDKFSRAKLGVTVRVQLEEGEDAAQVIGMARKSVSDALEQQIALELERGR